MSDVSQSIEGVRVEPLSDTQPAVNSIVIGSTKSHYWRDKEQGGGEGGQGKKVWIFPPKMQMQNFLKITLNTAKYTPDHFIPPSLINPILSAGMSTNLLFGS